MASTDFDRDDSGKPNLESMMNMAIRAAQDGNHDSARVMFRRVLNEDRFNARAMLWLAKLSGTQEERKQWLQRVLVVDPENKTAQNALRQMTVVEDIGEDRTLVIFGIVVGVLVVLGIVLALVFVVLS